MIKTGTGRVYNYSIMIHTFIHELKLSDVLFDNHYSSTPIMCLYALLVSLNIIERCYSQTMASLRDRDSLRKEDKMPVPKVSFVQRLDCIRPLYSS